MEQSSEVEEFKNLPVLLFQTEAQCLTGQFTLRSVWEFELLPPVNFQLPVSLYSEAYPDPDPPPLMKAVVCVAGWGGLPWMEPPRMMCATASAPGQCAATVSVSGPLSSSWRFAAAFFSWGTEAMEVTQPCSWRTDWTGLLQRQWINLWKFWAGCIEMCFSHRFPICLFSFLEHFFPDYTAHYSFPLIYVLFVQYPCIPRVTIDYKYALSPPFTHQ